MHAQVNPSSHYWTSIKYNGVYKTVWNVGILPGLNHVTVGQQEELVYPRHVANEISPPPPPGVKVKILKTHRSSHSK